MKVRFWGTRGSIPKPGHATLRHGGNTACIEVRSNAGTLIVLDCGSGAHDLGQALLAQGRLPVRGHLLITHTHWDHIQGVPFFAPFFVPGNEWDIYAPRGLAQSLHDTLAGQMQYAYFPITLEQLGASIRFHELVEGVFQVGDVLVRTQYLNHPALTLGYRLEADGSTLVYACDHEPYARQLGSGRGQVIGQDRRHVDFLAGADLVIHDAQYTADEYPAKVGWGHSTVEYAMLVAGLAGAKRLAFTHHDPLRSDEALDTIGACARAGAGDSGALLDVFAAAEGMTVELGSDHSPTALPTTQQTAIERPPALREQFVLLALADPVAAKIISDALQADEISMIHAPDAASVLHLAASGSPSLIILGEHLPTISTLELCRQIRGIGMADTLDVPIIIVAQHEDLDAGAAAGVSDWLVQPFSSTYARTRIRAWLMRVRCRWLRARLPADEEPRLAALHRLGVLDTEPEERFDRLTRLAAALFDVPLALVSLIDRDRQWLKSCHGRLAHDTSRETSFCAHAILGRAVMVVPDALLDPRFADNPHVTAEPYIRFYAGCPLTLPEGSCVGTLCILDHRPRQLNETEIRLLQDLGHLVETELAGGGRTIPMGIKTVPG